MGRARSLRPKDLDQDPVEEFTSETLRTSSATTSAWRGQRDLL